MTTRYRIGDLAAAEPLLQEALEQADHDDPGAAVRLASLLAERGDNGTSTELVDSVDRWAHQQIDSDDSGWDFRWLLAAVAAVRQQPADAVVEWLDQAYERGFNLARQHRTDPLFEAYHDAPQYRALGERMQRDLDAMRRASRPIVASLGLPID